MKRIAWSLPCLAFLLFQSGCCAPSVTAVSLTPNADGCYEPTGIPFYLPKPLLVIAKNFRYVEEAKVGLTDGVPIPNNFDDQAKYADVNARLNANPPSGSGGTPGGGGPKNEADATNGGAGTGTASGQHVYSDKGPTVTPQALPRDGLTPDTFYTYQIIFVPDLTQKYGLKIKGGVGEFRAAMNLVNGWQFTGLGPYYMKDSSTAQDILANGFAINLGGGGVANVIKSLADLRPGGGKPGSTEDALKALKLIGDLQRTESYAVHAIPQKICNFAEIHVLEPIVSAEGQMEWREIFARQFDRDFMGTLQTSGVAATHPRGAASEAASGPVGMSNAQDKLLDMIVKPTGPEASAIDPATLRLLVGHTLGVAPAAARGAEAAGPAVAAVPPGGTVNNVNVNCKEGCGFSLGFPGFGWCKKKEPTVFQDRQILGAGALVGVGDANQDRSSESSIDPKRSTPGAGPGTAKPKDPVKDAPAAGAPPCGVFQQQIMGVPVVVPVQPTPLMPPAN